MFIAKKSDLIILAKDTREELINSLKLMSYDSIEETNIDYVLYNGSYITAEEAAEQAAQQEAERIAKLHLTRGDVFRGLLLAKQVTRSQLRAVIEALPDETPEQQIAKEYALIDFDEALDFYRGNALIDTVGAQLGITTNQMTAFFETGDYHALIGDEENESNSEN